MHVGRVHAGAQVLGVSLWSGFELSRQANFKSFGLAFLTLFRISIGEDWCESAAHTHTQQSTHPALPPQGNPT